MPSTQHQPVLDIYPLKLSQLATTVRGNLTKEDELFVQQVKQINWNKHHLKLSRSEDIRFAAHALALGFPVFHGFGNFYALTFYPHKEVIRSVNAAKGRPLDQLASVTTIKKYLEELFDWDKLPQGFTCEQIMTMMHAFFEIGPFGFRGPAAKNIPEYLTKEINGQRTIQVIAPGYHCPSNELLTLALEEAGLSYFAATSPNISRNVTGVEEPAHFRIKGIKKDFGSKEPGFVMVAHKSESHAKKMHPIHDQMSTSIISFDGSASSRNGKPTVTIERHGSLPLAKITAILDKLHIGHTLSVHASQRLALRKYPLMHRLFNKV